jgi:hypothetical protein
VPLVGLDLVREQVERLHDLWARRADKPVAAAPRPIRLRLEEDDRLPPAAWERALGELVIGRWSAENGDPAGLSDDPGVRIVEGLIQEFRASMIVGVLRLTSRLIMLALGPEAFRVILDDYWGKTPPQMYASLEADAFARYLCELNLGVPHLDELLRFEQAITATLTDGTTRVVEFAVEPIPLLRALAEGRLPDEPPQPGRYEIELTPDGPIGATGVDVQDVEAAFPYH